MSQAPSPFVRAALDAATAVPGLKSMRLSNPEARSLSLETAYLWPITKGRNYTWSVYLKTAAPGGACTGGGLLVNVSRGIAGAAAGVPRDDVEGAIREAAVTWSRRLPVLE